MSERPWIPTEPQGKSMLTPEIVAEIIECLKPGIQSILARYGRKYFHVVVIDPVDRKTILFCGPVGGPIEEYPREYNTVAMLKAVVSARTRMDTGEVVTSAAHLLAEGDVIYQGGVNYRGLVVAGSGAQAPVDEAIALMIASQLSAYCQVRVNDQQAIAAKGGSYLIPPTEPQVPASS